MSLADDHRTDPTQDSLFDIETTAGPSLADRYQVPPMSVLDRRSGTWKARKASWLGMGIQSEIGRHAPAAIEPGADQRDDFMARAMRGEVEGASALLAGGTSIFDPVLCELVYRWFSRPGDTILDPFAGGSVRGIVAGVLARRYLGVELRPEQVAANRAQVHLATARPGGVEPEWREGDATALPESVPDGFEADLILTCPPYSSLERYSDDPRDLSTMAWDDFMSAQQRSIEQAAEHLRPDRFAVWVTSDVRDNSGNYRDLPGRTIEHFRAAGMHLRNDLVLTDPVGAAAMRAGRSFRATRTTARVHQRVLTFCKGSASTATQRLDDVDDA